MLWNCYGCISECNICKRWFIVVVWCVWHRTGPIWRMRRCRGRWDTTTNSTSSGRSRDRDCCSGQDRRPHALLTASAAAHVNVCVCVCVCAAGSWKPQTRSWADRRIVWSTWSRTQTNRSTWRRNAERRVNLSSRRCLGPSDLWTLCRHDDLTLHCSRSKPDLTLFSSLVLQLQQTSRWQSF